MKDDIQEFSLDELCALVELPKRTVRYYIQLGLVDRPEGANRGARYTTKHLDQLLTVRKWKNAGLSLERIRELLPATGDTPQTPPPRPRRPGDVEVVSRIIIAEGVELIVDPRRAGLPPEDVRELAGRIMEICSKMSGKEEQ